MDVLKIVSSFMYNEMTGIFKMKVNTQQRKNKTIPKNVKSTLKKYLF
jgi:hypothetical protein